MENKTVQNNRMKTVNDKVGRVAASLSQTNVTQN